MSSNIDKIKSLLSSRGIKSIPEARIALAEKISDEHLLDEVIVRLVDEDFLLLADDGPVGNENVYILSYQRGIAFLFNRAPEHTRTSMKNELSFALDWFTPSDANAFIDFCIHDKLITEDKNTGEIRPCFDISTINVPLGWSLNEELQLRTGTEVAREALDKKMKQKEVGFVMEEYRGDVEKQLAEDGIFDSDALLNVDVPFDGVEDRLVSSWASDRKSMVNEIIDMTRLASKKAYNLYDYYELNHGIIDFEMFLLNSIQHEDVRDEKLLGKVFNHMNKIFTDRGVFE